jgi:hypothetical protein
MTADSGCTTWCGRPACDLWCGRLACDLWCGRLACVLLAALVFTLMPANVGAATPGLIDYLHACGIGNDAFARFSDDRQIADVELDVIRRIAIRLRDCPPERLAVLMHVDGMSEQPPVRAAKVERGRGCRVQGTLVSVEPVNEPSREILCRCVVAQSANSARVVVYTSQLPEKLRSGGTGQRVACAGPFVKFVPGTPEPMAVVVVPRMEWRPESPLADLGMDFGLLEKIQDRSPMTAADYDAFYALLLLAKDADPARLSRWSRPLDDSAAGLAALFRDPAAQRGRLVTLSGTPRRVMRIPIQEAETAARLGTDHYFEIDLVPENSQNNPLVLCTLALPEGMTPGTESRVGPGPAHVESVGPGRAQAENPGPGRGLVEASGFFFKLWEYPTAISETEKAAHPGSSLVLQAAPLLVGQVTAWKPAVRGENNFTATAMGGLLALVIVGVGLLLWHLRQSDQEFSRYVMHTSTYRSQP